MWGLACGPAPAWATGPVCPQCPRGHPSLVGAELRCVTAWFQSRIHWAILFVMLLASCQALF